MYKYIQFFKDLTLVDIPQVGGKNASLGEMVHYLAPQGVHLPNGFATTSDAYRYFLSSTGLSDRIRQELEGLDVDDIKELAKRGAKLRSMIIAADLPQDFEQEIREGYRELSEQCGRENLVVAIRSSA